MRLAEDQTSCMPPNTTSLLRPVDQWLVATFKTDYLDEHLTETDGYDLHEATTEWYISDLLAVPPL
jgi:hypothetical protein